MSRNDKLDQSAHLLLGLALGLIGLDRLFVWWREWVWQWPPATERQPVVYVEMRSGLYVTRERVADSQMAYLSAGRVLDTARDMGFYAIGGTIGNVVTVVLASLFLAGVARGETTEVRYINSDDDQTYEAIRLCNEAGCLPEILVSCAPGATCSTPAEHPHGYHVLRIEARDHLLTNWSVPSNEIQRAIPRTGWPIPAVPLVCKADIDGDGVVQGDDFSLFLAAFGQSCSVPVPVLE